MEIKTKRKKKFLLESRRFRNRNYATSTHGKSEVHGAFSRLFCPKELKNKEDRTQRTDSAKDGKLRLPFFAYFTLVCALSSVIHQQSGLSSVICQLLTLLYLMCRCSSNNPTRATLKKYFTSFNKRRSSCWINCL